MLPVIVLVLAQALAIQANVFKATTHPASDLGALCADKKVALTDISQIRSLAESLNAGASESDACSENTRQGLLDLVRLIDQTQGDLCAVSSIDSLRDFYIKYLDSSKTAENSERLPGSLKKFALAYGMQMSNLCKKNMVKVLTEEAREILTAADFEELEKLISDEGPVAEVLGAMGGPDEIFLPGDVAPVLRKQGLETRDLSSEKLFMQTSTGPYIKHLQAVCERRFKPIYGPLMMPLVKLSNLGFNYKDEPLKCDLKCPTVVKEVGQWSRIVFLCEVMMNVEIVEEKGGEQEVTEGTGTKVVRILTKEEAEAMGGATRDAHEDESVAEIVYVPHELVSVTDHVLDKSDARLMKSLKTFRTNQSEEDVIRKRMMSKGKALVKNQLKKGHVSVVLSAAYKGLLHKSQKKDIASPSELMVRQLDEMIEQQQSGSEGQVSIGFLGMLAMNILTLVIGIIIVIILGLAVFGGFGLMG